MWYLMYITQPPMLSQGRHGGVVQEVQEQLVVEDIMVVGLPVGWSDVRWDTLSVGVAHGRVLVKTWTLGPGDVSGMAKAGHRRVSQCSRDRHCLTKARVWYAHLALQGSI
jgi:hypothetical protein